MLQIIATLGGIQLLAVVFNVLRSKLLAVLLGPQGIGATSVVDQATALVLQISALSLPFASVRFLSRAHSQGPDAFRHTYSGLIKAVIVLTSIGAALGLVVIYLEPSWVGEEFVTYRGLLIPAFLSIPAMALHYYIVQVLAAARQVRLSGLFLLAIAIVQAAGALLGTMAGGLAGYYWAMLLCNYLLVIAMLLLLRFKFSLPILDRQADLRREIRTNPDIVSYTLIMFSISYVLPLSNMLARLSILRTSGASEVGLMQAAIGLAAALNLVLNPANGLYLTPMMNRADSPSQKVSTALEFQHKLLLVMPVIAVPMVLFARLLLFLFYSKSFLEVSQYFFLFVIAQFLVQLAGIGQAVLIGLSDLIVYVIMVGLGQLSLGLVAWGLAPVWGISGVAVGYIFSSLAIFILCNIRLAIRHGWSMPLSQWALVAYGLLGLILAGLLFRHSTVDVRTVLLEAGYFLVFILGLGSIFGRQELRQVLARFFRTVALENSTNH
jgi:O-antigen/teichoic acid export membrane protein